MSKKETVFQALDKAIRGNWGANDVASMPHVNSYDMSSFGKNVLYKTTDKDDYAQKKLELQQNKYLKDRWVKANVNLSVTAYAGLNNIKLMYRDADLMDAFPEIGAALDTISEESCLTNDKGMIVNVYSKSDRVKNILEDLFVNRLNIQLTGQMVIRAMCKYGNQFMLLNIDKKNGIKGWKQLPVFNVERIENGIQNPYGAGASIAVNGTNTDDADLSTQFVWLDDNNSQVPFREWQVAHFRLLSNSLYLPYGVSYLNAARRHWRMLSLMEDMMLIYRLERSIERRVYKIFVGAIDDADVEAYVERIANEFKRTPIIDPMTGQVDLRKNILPVWKKTPIPLLDGRTITIEELAKEFQDGKTNYVYSVQDKTKRIVPGKVVWCGKNYTADKMIKVTLDDDTYVVMAPEHEVIMRDGTKKRCDQLSIGESLMPFYRTVDKNSEKKMDRYEKIYNPHNGKYEFTHRLIAEHVEKQKEEFNTVHHKNFNKYDNTPTNLLWCDFHAHHKMHSELAKQLWADPNSEANKQRRQKLSESTKKRFAENPYTDAVKSKISSTLKEKYASGELDWVKKITSKNISQYNVTQEAKEERTRRGKQLGYRQDFKEYNNSYEHYLDDELRRQKMTSHWHDAITYAKHKEALKVRFDDEIWSSIREAILRHEIYNRQTMLNFINTNLITNLLKINKNKRLEHKHAISRTVLQDRIKENGFNTITEYIDAVKKNHKVKFIEYINGDDVYCMTVVGFNGEDDRHNFAMRSFVNDDAWCENGIFVSNCVDQDIFIPVRDENAPTPIDTLSAAQNMTALDDIKFVQNKVLTALRIPKSFLNFEENAGDGKNLALMDIRFTRTVNRVQQAFLMELTRVASIHLFLLGFDDELTNFTLSMNNPSTQAEQLEIENMQKKIDAVRDAVSDPGNGLPVMSQTRALKQIMKWSEKEIKENFEEIRLEKGIAAELEKTSQIIKKTGIFDTVDRIYGEPGAEYMDDQQGQGGMDDGSMGGGGGGGMPSAPPMDGGGGDVGDLGGVGGDENGDLSGQEGSMPTQDMGGGDAQQPPMESRKRHGKVLTEQRDTLFDKYLDSLSENRTSKETMVERADVYDENALFINEDFDKMINALGKFVDNKDDKE